MVAPLCWVRRFTVVGFLVALNGRVDATCASGSTTLSTEDCSGCEDYDLCLGYTSASSCSGSGCETEGDCTYKCLSADKSSEKLVVLVEFGTYKSDEELAAGGYTESDLAGYPDETSDWPSVSNDDVTALGRISVSSAVTTFIASGGTAAVEYPKGKVSNIILSSNVISSATSVTSVGLMNLALKNQIDTLSAFVPTSLESLDLSNTLLSTFPAKLSTLQVLKELVLDNNYVTTVDSTNGIDSITTLSMQNNDLANFSAVFSKVENLYLGGNNLTSIPSAIYSYSSLKTLNLTGNPLASRDFTSDQVNFLNSLETLGLSASDFSTDSDCSREGSIFDVAVCITDGGSLTASATPSGATVAPSPAASDGSDTTTTTKSSSSSSSMSWIVGIVCGAFVILFAAFIFVLHRRKEHKKVDVSIASDTVGYSDHYSSTDNWHQLLQSRGRSSSFDDIPMVRPSSEVSMGIPTLTNEQNENENTEVAVVGATAVSSIPSFVSTEEAGSKGKTQRFMSIWNDLELLSLQLRASAIKDLKPLGSGAYATVWLVRYRNLQLLASKRLRPERRTKKHTAAFVEEIKLIANFDHPNLIPYDNVRASNGKIMSDLTILHRVASGKLHPKVRSTCGKALKDLVERCLLEDPDERPTAPAIAYELRVIQQEMAGAH
ncbi:hypothetical protein PC112_g10101 [Phytophthora cactorum]|nr:hypothetical protein PC112_g10101 [Phytophthora cactorum]